MTIEASTRFRATRLLGIGNLGTGDVSAEVQTLIDQASASGDEGLRLPADTEVIAAGLLLPSNFEFDLNGSRLVHPDGEGSTAGSVISSPIYSATGDVDIAGAVTGASIPAGVTVSIHAAGDDIQSQVSPLTNSIGAGDTTLTVDDDKGWATITETLRIGTELITYATYAAGVFSGCVRGAFGTTAAGHTTGDPVALAGDHYCRSTSQGVTPPPVRAVTGATLQWGSKNVEVHGGEVDCQRDLKTQATPNTVCVDLPLARRWSLDDLLLSNADHGGVMLRDGASSCNIGRSVTISDIGEIAYRTTPGTATAGACVWVFAGASDNDIRCDLEGEWQAGVFIDDRSVQAHTADQAPKGNRVSVRANLETPLNAGEVSTGVNFGGFSFDHFVDGEFSGMTRGISVQGSGQGPVVGVSSRFDVKGLFADCTTGVVISAASHVGSVGPVVTQNVTNPLINNGTNVVEIPTSSQGLSGTAEDYTITNPPAARRTLPDTATITLQELAEVVATKLGDDIARGVIQ